MCIYGTRDLVEQLQQSCICQMELRNYIGIQKECPKRGTLFLKINLSFDTLKELHIIYFYDKK